MQEPSGGGFRDTGPVALDGSEVTITASGGDAAGRDINKNVSIDTFVQYVIRQERARSGDGRRPYPGLRAFAEGWEEFFHGREPETEQALELLVGSPLSAVVGASGSGKSSLLAAGVAHALRDGELPGSDRWTVNVLGASLLPVDALCTTLRAAYERAGIGAPLGTGLPGPTELRADPGGFGRLSANLARRTGGRVVWLLDQFEALLAPELPEADRECLVGAVLSVLTEGADAVHVMIALRSDLYHRLECSAGLATAVAAHQYWLLPLEGDGLRRAVRLPAEQVGLQVEDQLVERIVHDAGSGPGSLPLIAYALERLWERRSTDELTLVAYEEIGGIAAGLDSGAQRVWASLDDTGRATARRTLVRLAHVGAGQRPTRRTVLARDLFTEADGEQAVLRVVMPFVEARLLLVGRPAVGDEPFVEVAHEVLLDAWRLLREWLAEDPKAKQLQDEIAAQTARWQEEHQDEGFLLQPGQLRLLDRLDADAWSLNEAEHAYVEASRAAAARARLTRERARRLRVRWAVTSVGLVLALVFGATVSLQQRATERAKTAAEALRLSAQARSASGERRDVAALLALAGVQTNSSAATRSALVDVLAEPGGQLAVHRARFGTATANALASAPARDGSLVLGCSDGSVRLTDPVTGAERRIAGARHDDAVSAVTTAEGGLVISGDESGAVILQRIDGTAAAPLRLRLPARTPVRALAMDTRTDTLLAGGADGVVARWQVRATAAEALPAVWTSHEITAITVHRPGQAAAVATAEGHVLEIPTTHGTGSAASDTELHAPGPTGLDLAARRGGGLVVTDGTQLSVWTATVTSRRPATADAPRVTSLVADPRSDTVYTGDASGHVQAWTTAGRPLPDGEVLRGPPSDTLTDLAIDGRLLAALTSAGRLVVWDLSALLSPAATASSVTPDAPVTALAHGPDGTLAAGDMSGMLRLSGRAPYDGFRLSLSSEAVRGLAWTSGSSLLVATADGSLHGVDLRRGTHTPVMARPSKKIVDVRAAPDGTAVAAWEDGTVLMRGPGKPTERLRVTQSPVTALAVGTGGEVAVAAGNGRSARVLLWLQDPAHTPPKLLSGYGQFVSSLAFSPDGRRLASGGDDRDIHLWSLPDVHRLTVLAGHTDTVRTLVWNGRDLLASGSEDGTVRLWDTTGNGQGIGRPLRYADREIRGLSASPDGRDLVAANGNYVVRWPFTTRAWSDLACTVAAGALDSGAATEYSPGFSRGSLCR